MDIRLVQAPISLVFSIASNDEESYDREFQQLNESDDDAISQWLKTAKARGETSETDPVLLNLVVELHRKIDSLERLIKNEEPSRLSLTDEEDIESIGFEYFKLKNNALEVGQIYYGRVEMPVHPKRDIPVFFEAVESSLAKLVKIHDGDEKEWGSYLTARERVLIRQAREKK